MQPMDYLDYLQDSAEAEADAREEETELLPMDLCSIEDVKNGSRIFLDSEGYDVIEKHLVGHGWEIEVLSLETGMQDVIYVSTGAYVDVEQIND